VCMCVNEGAAPELRCLPRGERCGPPSPSPCLQARAGASMQVAHEPSGAPVAQSGAECLAPHYTQAIHATDLAQEGADGRGVPPVLGHGVEEGLRARVRACVRACVSVCACM